MYTSYYLFTKNELDVQNNSEKTCTPATINFRYQEHTAKQLVTLKCLQNP